MPISIENGTLRESTHWDYSLLPLPGKDWTRLLRLYRDPGDTRIRSSLEICQLPLALDFVAVSYCWGSLSLDHCLHIFHDDQEYELKITANLYDTISQIRGHVLTLRNSVNRRPDIDPSLQALNNLLEAPSILLWADAICIDQANNLEKADQICLMPSIFSASKITLAQLGPVDDITTSDLEVLQDLCRKCYCRAGQLPKSWTLASQDDIQNLQHASDIITKIFSRNWFQRAWCLQEGVSFSLNKDRYPIFMLGPHMLSWPFIFGSHLELVLKMPPNLRWDRARTPRPLGAMNMLDFYSIEQKNLRLSALLCTAAGRIATIPRDKIYALLGILFDRDGLPQPDYSVSDDDVCISFTRSMIRQEERLFVMQCLNKTKIQDVLSTSLPTWCMSLHQDCHFSMLDRPSLDVGVVTNFINAASARRQAILLPVQSLYDRVLHIRGQCFDQVHQVVDGSILHSSEWYLSPSWHAMQRTLLKLYEDLTQTLASEPFNSESMKLMLNITQAGMRDLKHFPEVNDIYLPYLSYVDMYWNHLADGTSKLIAPGPVSDDTLRQYCEEVLYHDPAHLPNVPGLQELGVPLDWLQEVMVHKMMPNRDGWTFFSTVAGRLGAAVCRTRPGDKIFLVPGSSTPMVMREVPDVANAWHFRGEAYIPGIMQGEAYDDDQLEDMHIH